MKLFPKILTVATSVLLAAGSLAVAPIGANQSASAETIISQLGSDIDGEAVNDYSGYSVSLSSDGTRVAIGAYSNDGNGNSSGHVRIYELSGGTWSQLGSDIDGEAANDNSGYSVSLSSDGTRVAIGAPFNDGNGNNSGHVRLYEWNAVTSAWDMFGEIDGEAADDLSGYSVSLSSDGTRVAISAPYNDDNGGSAGHVRVYDLTDGAWVKVGQDIDGEAADDSGFSVSFSSDGTTVAIGALDNDGSFADAGHVRVYSMAFQASAPAPYTGPLLQDYSSRTLDVCTPKSITITGIRLLGATASVQGKSVTVLENTDTKLVLAVPAGLTPGNNVDLVINSSSGTLTHQDAFDIPADTCAAVLSKGRWTQLQSDGKTVKIYAKDPIGDGKIQFFVDGKEIAWVNAVDEADPKLSFASSYPYLVRSVALHEGKNRFEIKLDGVRVWRATYVPKG